MAGEFFEGLPQAGQAFGPGVFIAGPHFHAEADPQIGHKITVINVAGTSGLLYLWDPLVQGRAMPRASSACLRGSGLPCGLTEVWHASSSAAAL